MLIYSDFLHYRLFDTHIKIVKNDHHHLNNKFKLENIAIEC